MLPVVLTSACLYNVLRVSFFLLAFFLLWKSHLHNFLATAENMLTLLMEGLCKLTTDIKRSTQAWKQTGGVRGGGNWILFQTQTNKPREKNLQKKQKNSVCFCVPTYTGNSCVCLLASIAFNLHIQTAAAPEVFARACRGWGQGAEESQRRFLKVYVTSQQPWRENTGIIEVCSRQVPLKHLKMDGTAPQQHLSFKCVCEGESFACSLLCRCVFETERNFHIYHCVYVCT